LKEPKTITNLDHTPCPLNANPTNNSNEPVDQTENLGVLALEATMEQAMKICV
jgi:hypothetical protein